MVSDAADGTEIRFSHSHGKPVMSGKCKIKHEKQTVMKIDRVRIHLCINAML